MRAFTSTERKPRKAGATFPACPVKMASGNHPQSMVMKSVVHDPGKMIMDTGYVELYPCLRCGLVFWLPRSR